MIYEPVWTIEAADTYAKLKARAEQSVCARAKNMKTKATRDEGLFKQVHKCVTHLLANPKHPGLQTHEYHSFEHPYQTGDKVFEAYVQNRTPGAYRLFWCYGPNKKQITILSITLHP